MTAYYYHGDRCPEHTNTYQDDPLSSQTPDFVYEGHSEILVQKLFIRIPCPPGLRLHMFYGEPYFGQEDIVRVIDCGRAHISHL